MFKDTTLARLAIQFRRWRQHAATEMLDDHLREDIGLPPRGPRAPTLPRMHF